MKPPIFNGLLLTLLLLAPMGPSYGQLAIAEIIKAGIKRVIKAADLRIQRLQNQTIWLQNVQKEIENTLSKLKLEEIATWSQRQRDLYQQYYDELRKVKNILSYHRRIKDVVQLQQAILVEYQRAWRSLSEEVLFTAPEKLYMQGVYQGMLRDCMENLDLLSLVLRSFATQMSDAERLAIIRRAHEGMQQNYMDMKAFNTQNQSLRLDRKKTQQDILRTKKLYGID